MPKPPPQLASVVNLRSVRRRVDFGQLACSRFAADRAASGLSCEGFAEALSEVLGYRVEPEDVTAWETAAPPPGDIHLAAEEITTSTGGRRSPAGRGGDVLGTVPPVLPATDLEGPWVTGYEFHHGAETRRHVDIAHIAATSDRDVTIMNYPPAPRTEGRGLPFRNEIDAQVANRHLVGHWRNTSDARYFGLLHLAILPGETVMEGFYTGFGSDISVSLGHWRWVRLEPATLADVPLAEVVLREPATLYDLVNAQSQYDGPLTLADVREAA